MISLVENFSLSLSDEEHKKVGDIINQWYINEPFLPLKGSFFQRLVMSRAFLRALDCGAIVVVLEPHNCEEEVLDDELPDDYEMWPETFFCFPSK